MVDFKNRVTYEADTSGLARAKQAVDDLARSEAGLEQTTARLTSTQATREKSEIAVTKSADAYIRANLETEKALARVIKGEQLLRDAQRQGSADVDKLSLAVAAARAKHDELTKAANDNSDALSLNRAQMMELTHVGKSLFDMMAAGASPFRALQVEAGRIGQILTSGQGGVLGTLRAMGSALGGLATGWVGFGLAAAAGIGAAAVAVTRFQSQQDRLALSLNGAGRFAGVGVSGLTGIANAAGARNPALGQGGATDLVAQLAATGRISAAIMPGIADLVTPYARGSGQDLAKSGEEITKAFSSGAKGAGDFLEKLGALDARTREHIESLEKQGDLLGMQQVLLDKAADAAGKMADRTWNIARAWETISGAVGRTFSAAGGAISSAITGPQTTAEFLAEAQGRRANFAAGNLFGERNGGIAALDEQIRGLGVKQYGESRLQGAAALDKATNDLSIQVVDVLKRALPDAERVRDLNDTIALLDRALKDPSLIAKVPGGAAAIGSARGIAQNQLTLNDPLRLISDDSRLAIASAQAVTLAQRERVESERAYVAALREGKTEAIASAAAEAKRNEMLAQAQRELDDLTKSATRNLATSTMRPYQRALAEVGFQFEDVRDRLGGGIGGAASPAGGAAAGGGSTAAWAAGVNAELVRRTEALLGAIPGLSVISGARSASEGYALIEKYRGTNHPVAKNPFNSMHYEGRPGGAGAVDLGGDPALIARARSVAGQFGLSFPVPGDFNHMQLAAGAGPAANSNNPSGYVGNTAAAQNAARQAAINSFTVIPLRDANDSLRAQADLLRLQAAAAGKSTSEIAGLVAKQTLLNDLTRQGVPITEGLRAQLELYGKTAAGVADSQERLGKTIEGADLVRSGVHDGLRTFIGDMIQGKNAATAFRDAMAGLGQKILDVGLNNLVDGLLGKSGTNSGLGGLIGSFFGGGGGGGNFGLPTSTSFFAGGGVMTGAGPLPLRKYASGGVASAPQLAMYGEGSTPEAFVPLPDGRRIPVALRGGGGGAPISVGGPTLNVAGSIDAATMPQVEAMMTRAIAQHHAQLQRNLPAIMARAQSRYAA